MKRLSVFAFTVILLICLSPVALATDSQETQSAQVLYELGLFKGTGTNADGTPIFDLDKTPTRNQALIMLVRLLGKEQDALTGDWHIPFTDVSTNMIPYIGYAYTYGLTNGTSATTYSGTNPITSNQYITFVLRALGYESGKDFQVSSAWTLSDKIGLTNGQYNTATSTFIRGDVANISRSALSVKLKDEPNTLAQKLMDENVFTQKQYDAILEQTTTLPTQSVVAPSVKTAFGDPDFHELMLSLKPSKIRNGLDLIGTEYDTYSYMDHYYFDNRFIAYEIGQSIDSMYSVLGVFEWNSTAGNGVVGTRVQAIEAGNDGRMIHVETFLKDGSYHCKKFILRWW